VNDIRMLDATAVAAALPTAIAIDAVRTALRDGLDPAADPTRGVVPLDHGHLLIMPAQWGEFAGVKVASVAPDNPAVGRPRIQGKYLLMDGPTLTPLAVLDGIALTAIRTAAVSAVAADLLAEPDATTLLVFGSGPQAHSHVAALREIRRLRQVIVVGRDAARAEAFAAEMDGLSARTGSVSDIPSADIVACCTSARTPLFDGTLLARHATVIAVGSHEADAAEVDAATVTGSTVVVEAAATALREAGDIIQAGVHDANALVELATLVRDKPPIDMSRPRLFKSVGMAWEDLVLAARAYRAG
jgi:ornithine cyclodeaminase/alanine dehydrogenase-like protein (mu-crystallin family)